MTTACPLDGHLRRPVYTDRHAEWWACGWCGETERIETANPLVLPDEGNQP